MNSGAQEGCTDVTNIYFRLCSSSESEDVMENGNLNAMNCNNNDQTRYSRKLNKTIK
jgi:hypothetical protein